MNNLSKEFSLFPKEPQFFSLSQDFLLAAFSVENPGAAGAERVPAGLESGSLRFPQTGIRDPGIRIHLGLTPGCRQGPTEKWENAAGIQEYFWLFSLLLPLVFLSLFQAPQEWHIPCPFPTVLNPYESKFRISWEETIPKNQTWCFPLKILIDFGENPSNLLFEGIRSAHTSK